MRAKRFLVWAAGTLLVGVLAVGSSGIAHAQITFANIGSLSGDPAIEETIREFELETGIDVRIIEVPDATAGEIIQRALALGERTYDVIHIDTTYLPTWAEAGWILPLDEYLDDHVVAAWTDSAKLAVTYRGRIWAVPEQGIPRVFYYRKDLLSQAGFSHPPRTWDELVEAAKATTIDKDGDGNPEVYGYAAGFAGDSFGFEAFKHKLYSANGRLTDANGNLVVRTPEAVAALQHYRELAASGAMPPGVINYSESEVGELWRSGRIAMMENDAGAMITLALASPYGGHLGLAAPPSRDGSPARIFQVTMGAHVAASTQHPTEAIALVKWLGTYRTSWLELVVEGNVPVNRHVFQSPHVKRTTSYAGALEACSMIGFDDRVVNPFPITKTYNPFIQQVITGKLTAEEALRRIENQLRQQGIIK